MDQGRWDEFAELFAEDALQSWKPAPGEPPAGARGRAEVVAYIRGSLAGMRSTHHGHMPEIEVTGETSATGVWALFDYCSQGEQVIFDGAGYYRDTYVKQAGRWLIQSTELDAEPFQA
jgi:hypothetical protein